MWLHHKTFAYLKRSFRQSRSLRGRSSCSNSGIFFKAINKFIESYEGINRTQVDIQPRIEENLNNLKSLIKIIDAAALDLFRELSLHLNNIYDNETVSILKNALHSFDWNNALRLIKKLVK